MDKELENKVYQISEATNPDGTIDAEIDNVYEENGTASVEFYPLIPDGQKKKETMEWPDRDDDHYKLVRIARETVGDFSALPQIEGERVKTNPDTWLIELEGEKESFFDRNSESIFKIFAWNAVIGIAMMFVPMIFLLGYPFGLRGMTIGQGLSFMISGFVVSFIFAMIVAEAEE